MPIQYSMDPRPIAVLETSCVAEDADGLREFLIRAPDAVVDLHQCRELHTAVLQTLLAARAGCARFPDDSLLSACLTAGGLKVANPTDDHPAL